MIIATRRILPIAIVIFAIVITASTALAQGKDLQDIRAVAEPIDMATATSRISPQGGGVITPVSRVPAAIQVSAANAGETRKAILWVTDTIPSGTILIPIVQFEQSSFKTTWQLQAFQLTQEIGIGTGYFFLGISDFGNFWPGNAELRVIFIFSDGTGSTVIAPFQAYRGEIYRTTPIVVDLKTDNEVAILGKFNKDLPATVVFDNLVIGPEALKVSAGKVVINTKKTPFFSLLPGPYLVTVCQGEGEGRYCGSGLVTYQLPVPETHPDE